MQPIRDLDEAEFLRNEVPDVQIPDELLSRLGRVQGHQPDIGKQIALELISSARDLVEGVILVNRDESPLSWGRLINNVREVTRRAVTPDSMTG